MADSHKRTWSDTRALTALSSDGSEDSQMPFDHNQKTQEIMNATVTTAKLESEALAHLANYKAFPHRATAYSSKLRLEKPVDPHAILSAMLVHAPTAQGTRYVAAAIMACHESLPALGWLADTWLCYFMLPFMGNIDKARSPPSHLATRTMRDGTKAMLDPLEGDNMVRIRDGYQCIVTNIYNFKQGPVANPKAEFGAVHVAHLLKWSVGAFKQMEPVGPYTTWDIIKNFVGWSDARVAEVVDKMDTAVNGILLLDTIHSSWDNFAWTLKPVMENDEVIPHTYDVEVLDARQFRSPLLKNCRVTFRDCGSDEDVIKSTPKEEEHWPQHPNTHPLPDPELIALHRAICHILYMSGTAESLLVAFKRAFFADTPIPSSKRCNADELICLIEVVHLQMT